METRVGRMLFFYIHTAEEVAQFYSTVARHGLYEYDNDNILRVSRRDYAIRGAASPPLPYKHTGTVRAKKAPLVWTCRKTSRR